MRVRDNGLAGTRVSSIGLGDRAVRMRYGALDGTLVSLLELGGRDGCGGGSVSVWDGAWGETWDSKLRSGRLDDDEGGAGRERYDALGGTRDLSLGSEGSVKARREALYWC